MNPAAKGRARFAARTRDDVVIMTTPTVFGRYLVVLDVGIPLTLSKQSQRAASMLADFWNPSAQKSRLWTRGLHSFKFWCGHFQILGLSWTLLETQSRLATQDARILKRCSLQLKLGAAQPPLRGADQPVLVWRTFLWKLCQCPKKRPPT